MIVAITLILIIFLSVFYIGYFVIMRRNARKVKDPLPDNYFPLVSIIIPAYNEGKIIYKKLVNTIEQSYPNYELIIANDGSTDNTATEVNRFMSEHPYLKIIFINFSKRRGKSSVMTEAIAKAKGEILVFSDADTLIDKDAVYHIVKNYQDPSIGAVTGRLEMVNYTFNSSTKMEENYRDVFHTIRLGESNMDSTTIFNGALMSVRNGLLDDLSGAIAEDTEISLRVRQKGFRAIYEPLSSVYAETPKSFRLRMQQKTRCAQGLVASFIAHRHMLFNPAYGKYGAIIYPSEFFMHVLSPTLTLLSAVLIIPSLIIVVCSYIWFQYIIGAILFALAILLLSSHFCQNSLFSKWFKVIITVIEHELFLFLGLINYLTGKNSVKWERVNR